MGAGGLIQTTASARENVRARVIEVERQVDEGRYRRGTWEQVIDDARGLPRSERGALADDISRVSRKLHLRDGRRTLPIVASLVLEGLGALMGAIFLILAIQRGSNIFGILAGLLWVSTFQPLIKTAVGYIVNVDYEYGYLYGVEPRFKMRYGDYLAAPRWARVLLHLLGMAGSPLGAWLAAFCLADAASIASTFCWVVFWLVVAVNALFFVAGLAGIREIRLLRVSLTSGGMAGRELREALEF